jgi:uncharacterized protein with von Willebrand factor type A (vWA) domain
MTEVLPLEGVYLHLVRNGVPISVREFQEALAALAEGHGGLRRERLQWLCDTLWCRTEHESVLLEQLFRDLPRPEPALVQQLSGETAERSANDPGVEVGRQSATGAGAQASGQATPVQFAAPTETGSGLPRAELSRPTERFILTPRSIVSLRSLIVLWRRFRRAQRSGPKVEIDIAATVAEQGRRGRIAEPVLVPARRNQARLIMLVDASPSMAPWRRWNATLQESLRASQLAGAPLFYFDNVPESAVYERESLTHPIALGEVWMREPPAPLMIVSDGGAARGRLDRARVAATRAFLDAAQQYWSPVAWMNPMPAPRWRASSSGPIGRVPGVRMFELTEDGLIAGIDFLRGKTAGS